MKVGVKLTDRDYCSAYVHLEEDQRLQDLINDTRTFIPIYFMIDIKNIANYRCVLVNKSRIESIQEWRQENIPLEED